MATQQIPAWMVELDLTIRSSLQEDETDEERFYSVFWVSTFHSPSEGIWGTDVSPMIRGQSKDLLEWLADEDNRKSVVERANAVYRENDQ